MLSVKGKGKLYENLYLTNTGNLPFQMRHKQCKDILRGGREATGYFETLISDYQTARCYKTTNLTEACLYLLKGTLY